MGAQARHAANTDFYRRSEYIPGIWVDGMDVLACREAGRFLKQWCLNGNGPLCLELESYRYMGHSMSDPGTSYRTRDDVQKVKEERDSLAKLTARLLREKILTEDELKALERATNKATDAAVAEAQTGEDTHFEEVATDIYAGERFPVRSVDHTIHF
eukprot:NODE_2167_length_824_cov_175.224516_g1518_i0.p2 GENE.NODE_2167_length_824_cov_175.224516_g1518_i0~~NODE_2167_length_824_cov_175.224516_g1518_i0.p2  ORF type:complete len:168 (+),score=83.08 NODE_2167_length_824_cov_175.224516_g1518_i0:34-504(+)